MIAKRILILEDHDDSRYLYSEILRDEDYLVLEAADALKALVLLRNETPPDLIIMDLTLPYMSAQDFVEELRKHPTWPSIPIVVISGQVDIEEQANNFNAKSFIAKPFEMDDFIEVIKKAI
jgi:two-component system, chemotaxis family, chemotaxis protein CheY